MEDGRRKLVLTRTQQANENFVKYLIKHSDNTLYVPNIDHFEGGGILSVPMLDVEMFDFDAGSVEASEVLLVTSGHARGAVAAYQERHGSGGVLFAVGHVTSQIMRDIGWTGGIRVAGTAEELAQMMEMEVPYKAGVLYLRGQDISFDFPAAWERKDIKFVDKIVYKAHVTTAFPPFFEESVRKNEIGAVVFFSRRTALNFVNLLQMQGLLPLTGGIKALCISQSVLESVKESFDGLAYVAETPDAEGLAELVFRQVFEE